MRALMGGIAELVVRHTSCVVMTFPPGNAGEEIFFRTAANNFPAAVTQ